MADRLASIILKYQVDRNSLKQVERSTGGVYARLAELRGELNAIAPAGQKAGKGIENAVKSAEKQVDKTRRAVEELDHALTDVEKRKRITESQGNVSTGLGAAGSVLSALPGGGGAATELLRSGGDVFGLLEYKDRLIAGGKQLLQGTPGLIAFGAAGAAIGVGIAALTPQVRDLIGGFNELEKSVRANVQAARTVSELVSSGASTDQAEARVAELRRLLEVENALRAENQAKYVESARVADEEFGRAGVAFERLSRLFSADDAVANDIKLSEQNIATYEAELERLNDELERGAFTAADAAALLEKSNAQAISRIQERVTLESRLNDLLLTGTVESVNARRQVLERDISNIQSELQMLSDNGLAGSERFTQLNNSMRDMSEELTRISDIAFEAEVVFREANSRLEQERQAELERAIAYNRDRDKRLMDAQTRYNTDIETLTNRGLEQRAALEQKYADQLISIAEKAADESAAALQRLEEAQASAGLGLGRGNEDATTQLQRDRQQSQIDYQREESDSYKSHLQDLENIRRNAQDEEFDLVLNRDFAGLFKRRRQTTRELEDAQKGFNLQREERLEAFNRENEDQARQFEFERLDRLTNYQRELADAQAQFNQERQQAFANQQAELAQAAQTYQRERSELQNKQTQELNLRRTAYQQELQLAAQTYQQRNALQAKFDQAMLAQAQKTLDAISKGVGKAGSIALGSGGGALTPTPQQGNFSGASSDQSFSSSVNSKTMNAGGMTFNVFDSTNPQKIVDVLNGALRQYFGLN